jgi:SAM-dependent methyltransferase
MSQNPDKNQTDMSINKNISFFQSNLQAYRNKVNKVDTYVTIREFINLAIKGINRLLDIGNGGVFDYDVEIVPNIVALDLFLNLIDTSSYSSNIIFKAGSALDIPEASESFDGVIMVMLLHHLVGKTVEESLNNVHVAVREAIRVLMPGGKLIIVESCVPSWFYTFEKAIFPLASRVINPLMSHPLTMQYPVESIAKIVSAHKLDIKIIRIPKGRWVLQYGYKFPSMLTPVNPYLLEINKSFRI